MKDVISDCAKILQTPFIFKDYKHQLTQCVPALKEVLKPPFSATFFQP
jgi:hypothetical protein